MTTGLRPANPKSRRHLSLANPRRDNNRTIAPMILSRPARANIMSVSEGVLSRSIASGSRACIIRRTATSPRSKSGKNAAWNSSRSGSGDTRTVTSVRMPRRPSEPRTVVVGPFLFGVGIFSVVAFFEPAAATVGVLVLAIGDSAASIVGKTFGNTTLPYNPGKTLLGSLSLFAVGVLVAIFFVSVPWALLVGAVASLVESLPLGPSDNLLLPLATAGVVALALA